MADDRKDASPPVIDVESLLEPIPGDSPTGTDIRLDDSPVSPYYKIKDARNSARAAERQLERDPEATEEPDWHPVLDQAPKLLKETSKDLEVVAWYIEALIRIEGLAGVRDGFRLARELCERYWDGLFPALEDGNVEPRVAPLTGLNGEDAEGTLIGPIRKIQLTEGSSVGPYTAWQYEQALEVDKIADSDAKQRRLDAGSVALKDFLTAVSETGVAFFRRTRDDLAEARDEFQKLGATLDGKAGSAAPPTSNIRNAFDHLREQFEFATASVVLDPVEDEGGAEAAGGGAAAGAAAGGAAGGAAAGVPGAIRTREDAFRTLQKVAEFFKATEPHSPLAYSLEQTVRWGRMPLPDLLTELIPDESTREALFKLTGIRVVKPE